MLIDADNITVKYGHDTPLKQVSLCVHQGEFIGLIGPNGAGKTTLLRVLLKLVKPTTGHVTYADAQMGYVPQRGNLYNSQIPMSVLEVVRLGTRDAAAATAACTPRSTSISAVPATSDLVGEASTPSVSGRHGSRPASSAQPPQRSTTGTPR